MTKNRQRHFKQTNKKEPGRNVGKTYNIKYQEM